MESKCDDEKNSTEWTPMIKDLKANVFPTRDVRFVSVSAEGKKDVRVV